jgi:DNA-binding PadR family transcriptional regulator
MYRALRQMEKEGTILSKRDGIDYRLPRRKYSITESGED